MTRIFFVFLFSLFTLTSFGQARIDSVAFPASFKGVKENKIENSQALSRTFQKLHDPKAQARILQIGDSHVRGHFLPGYVRKAMEVTFGTAAMGDDPIGYNKQSIATETGYAGLVFSAIGINGATTKNYMAFEQIVEIASQRPDLIILSFGTNEGYGNSYSAERHAQQIETLVTQLRDVFDDEVEFLLTTPPGCYKKSSGGKKENPFNGAVAATIVNFALDHNFALWNLYDIAGGDQHACGNWRSGGFMQPDGVHYNVKGYELQGRLLGQAICKAALSYQ